MDPNYYFDMSVPINEAFVDFNFSKSNFGKLIDNLCKTNRIHNIHPMFTVCMAVINFLIELTRINSENIINTINFTINSMKLIIKAKFESSEIFSSYDNCKSQNM